MASKRLQGVTVLVTGGSAGIGAGCVRCLHNEGAQVAFCSNAPQEGLKLQTALGPERAFFVEADCRREVDIRTAVTKTVARFGTLDCLVNNVGWHPPRSRIDDFSAENFRNLFEINVMSGFLFCKEALPFLRRSDRSPSVINISSMVSMLGQSNACTYVATKGAITAFTKAMAIDEAVHGVRFNCISPSNIDTPLMTQNLLQDMSPQLRSNPAALKAALQQQADVLTLGRLGTPEDVGKACVFLASSDAAFLTGIDLHVSGGAELDYGLRTKMAGAEKSVT